MQVAKQLAECISLPDRTEVQVKAAANLPKATLVMIEPSTEDDWEILELNSELAEEAILKQVCQLFMFFLIGRSANSYFLCFYISLEVDPTEIQ